jgi:hypothetical protein
MVEAVLFANFGGIDPIETGLAGELHERVDDG